MSRPSESSDGFFATLPSTLNRNVVGAVARHHLLDIARVCCDAGLAQDDRIIYWFHLAIDAVSQCGTSKSGTGRKDSHPANQLKAIRDVAYSCSTNPAALQALFVSAGSAL